MALGNSDEEENRPACAACRHQRKKCKDDCLLWRHFPANKMEDFQAVHRVFGLSNVIKMIKGLDPVQQDRAIESFLWEAKLWREDPVQGPLGRFNRLEQELSFLRNQINGPQPQPQPRPVTAVPPAWPPETYQLLGRSGGFHPNFGGPSMTSHGYQLPLIQSNFGGTTNLNRLINVTTQHVRGVGPPRPPQQQHIPPLYNYGFGDNKENALVNNYPYYANVGISGGQQDRRSLIRIGDRTGNVVRPPAGPGGMPSKPPSSVALKHGDDQIVGRQTDEDEILDNEARDIIDYYDQQLLDDNTNQNNVQGN